jgi:protein-disulfide isomerase
MTQKHGWLVVLVLVALLVAACGPQMATPTPSEEVAASDSPTDAPVGKTPTATEEQEPTQEPQAPADLPVNPDDWHVLGSPDAPVTIIEYSDFQ